MIRMALYLAGISAGIAALTMYRRKIVQNRRVPVREAANLLQQAWADNRTRA